MKINQILIFFYSQVNLYLKCIYVLSNSTLYNHDILNFFCKIYFEEHINQSISKLFLTYFYDTKVIEILYSNCHKPNGGHDYLIFLITKLFNLFFYMYVKNCLNYKPNLKKIIFLSTLLCFCPCKFYQVLVQTII